MNIFENSSFDNHEQVVYCYDDYTKLKAIIAIHDSRLGPSIGGCRMYPYTTEDDALTDVLRLSRGMTYKSAITGLNFGGSKAVIIGNPATDHSEMLFRTFGRYVNSLNGRYITAEDSGTNITTMEWTRIETQHVVGLPTYIGGFGDPSPVTAHGVFVGIKATLKKLTGSEDLTAKKVAIQGVGHVGYYLCKELSEAGATLYVADINKENLKMVTTDFKVNVVEPSEIFSVDCDIFAPCALGAILNSKTIPLLKCSIVAGSANNQFADEQANSEALKARNILCAPDYAVNAGGLLDVAAEFFGASRELAWHKAEEIYNTLLDIYHQAEEQDISPLAAANKVAEARIEHVSHIKSIYARYGKSKR